MENLLDVFRSTGALLEGHFILTSGRHSPTYFQCARVLQHPRWLEKIAGEIVRAFQDQPMDCVISPAVGGIVLGTEVGRQCGVRSIFAERENGRMTLRRGLEIRPGERILVVEDVITTGGSVREVMELVQQQEGLVVGVGVVVDRSNGAVILHERQMSLVAVPALSYPPDRIPESLQKIPVRKPGSRGLI